MFENTVEKNSWKKLLNVKWNIVTNTNRKFEIFCSFVKIKKKIKVVTNNFKNSYTFLKINKSSRNNRVDRGLLSHIFFQDFCIMCILYLGRLWYAKVLSEPLARIKQYRIYFNGNTMVVNDHFIREGHLWKLSPEREQVVTSHSIPRKVISKLNWTKISVYSSTL